MSQPLAIVNALELVRAGRERRRPRPEYVILKDARLEPRQLEDDHSLVDEYSGDIRD